MQRLSFMPTFRSLLYVLIILVLSYGVAYAFYSYPTSNYASFFDKEEKVGVIGGIHTLNPLFVSPYTIEHSVATLLFQGLTTYDDTNQIIGALGESWDVREGGSEFLFHIKKDAIWSDGQPITADDVIFTYGIVNDEHYQGWAKGYFTGVEMDVIDPYTILFRLPNAYMPFLDSLTVPVIPAHLFPDKNIGTVNIETFVKQKVFNTDYTLDSFTLSHRPNGTSYQELRIRSENKKNFTLIFYPDKESMEIGFQLGEIDSMLVTDDLNAASNIDQQGISYDKQPLWGQYAVMYINTEKVNDLDVRKGIIQAIDTAQFPGEKAYGPLPSKSSFWSELAGSRVSFNLEAAKSALVGRELRLVYVDSPIYAEVAQTVAHQLGAAGVAVKLQHVTLAELHEQVIPDRDYDVLLLMVYVGRDPDQYSFWHSSQINAPGQNFTGLKNRRVDKALENGRANSDSAVRKEVYTEFQKNLLEEHAAVFLFHPYVHLINRQRSSLKLSPNMWDIRDVWK